MSNYGTVTSANGTVYDLGSPTSGVTSDNWIAINANGGTLTTSNISTSATWYWPIVVSEVDRLVYPLTFVIKAKITRTNYTISGWSNGASNNASSTISYNGSVISGTISSNYSTTNLIIHKIPTWSYAGATAPGAPGGVRVGTSSSYSSNTSSSYSVNIDSPGQFYITWTAGSAGTNNAISGYQRRMIRTSDSGVVSGTAVTVSGTSTLYSLSSGYGDNMVGVTMKAQVCTLGAAGINSGWTTSSNTIVFTKTTQTAPGAPGGVRVGTSSDYSSNTASNYNVGNPTPGEFYITWTAGSAGTNNAIAGYQRRMVRSSNGQEVSGTASSMLSSSARYHKSAGYSTSMNGVAMKGEVRTIGSVSGLDSNWTRSTNTITFTAASSGYTLTCNANGGSPDRSYTNTAGTKQTIDPPTRSGYNLKGWYFNSSTTNGLNYGAAPGTTTSFRVRFWTYASTYAQGTSSTLSAIVSDAEQGGWCLVCEDGTNWSWQVRDTSGWKMVNYARSNLSAGYHEWCLICDLANKQIKMYIDGTQRGSTVSLSSSSIYHASGITYNVIVGNELNTTGGYTSGYGFNGYIGNFEIDTGVTTYAAPDFSVVQIPAENATVYAYWERAGYTLTVRPNGGTWNGSTSDSTLEVIYGTNKTIAAPTRPGYNFIGWASVGSRFSDDYSAGTSFFTSVPNKYIWGGGGTNNSTLSLADMDTASGFTTATKMLQIVEPGSSTKGIGWYKTASLATNTAVIVAFVAKAPKNTYFIVHNSQSYQGTGYTYEYLTPMAGTGNWQTYCIKFVTGSSITNNATGYFVLCGNQNTISPDTSPGAVTYYVAWQNIGLASKINSSETYVPNTNLTSDTITAVWIEKKYDISYNLNGGEFPSGLDTVSAYYNSTVEAINPLSAQWNRSPYVMGNNPASGSGKPTAHSPSYWFYVERPVKDPNISESTTNITTSFNAASTVNSITSTETLITSTPNNFYSWTITGMDSGVTHQYYGRTSAATTTNSAQSFTSTSITLTGDNHNSGQPPLEYRNLSQTSGDVVFTAGWTPGTTSTYNIYSEITLPTVPAKSDTTATITRTVYYNANGGTGTTTAQSVSPTATVTWSDDDKWWTTSTGGTGYAQATTYTPTSSATLYAHYTASTGTYNSPNITLRSGTSKATDYIDVATVFLTTTFNAAQSVSPITSEKNQTDKIIYTFDKWRLNSISGTSYAAGATFTPTATAATFYATYTGTTAIDTITYSTITLPTVPTKASTTSTITRTVSYNANGGNSTPSSQSVSPTATVLWAADTKWYTSSAYTTVAGTHGTTYTPTSSATLYAQYTASTQTYSSPTIALPAAITFNNVSTTTTTTATLNFSAASAVTAKTTTKTVVSTQPKTFDKWRLGSASGTSYAAQATFTPTTGSTTFYATSKNNGSATSVTTYGSVALPNVPAKSNTTNTISRIVNYNRNGSTSATPSAQTVNSTATVTWSDDDKWYTAASGGTGYTQGTNYTLTADNGTVYAHYTASTGTYSSPTIALPAAVAFASVSTTTNTTVTINFSAASAVTAKTTTKTVTSTQPKTFDKWRLGSTTGTSYAANATFTPTIGSTTFYATSKNNGSATAATVYGQVTLPNVPAKSNTTDTITRTVKYNANGGSSTPSDQSVSPTATVTWSDDDKWYTAASGGTGYSQGSAYTLTADNGTVYAHYTASTGTYSSPSLNLSSAISKANTTATKYVVYDKNTGTTVSATSTSFVATTAYTFDKWRLGSTTGTGYAASAKYTPTVSSTTFYATFTSTTTAASVTTATATKANTTTGITLTYNVNTGTTVSPTNTAYNVTVSWSGNGWYTAASGGTKRANMGASYTPPVTGETVYAQWSESSRTAPSVTLPTATKNDTTANKTITYNANGGSVSPTSATYVVTTSYTNTQWNIGSASGTKLGNAGAQVTAPTSSTTVYAIWSSSDSSAAVTLPTPTRTGYTVTGWYSASSGGTKKGDAGASYTPSTSGETVYAQWSGYVVSVASASTTMGTASGGGTYAGSSLTITASPKTGYHFVKWTGGDVNNNTNTSVTFTPTSSFTATANFAANTYTVVYNANGGSGTMANSSFTYNGTGNLTANAFTAPSGYTFGGWASSVANATAGTVYRANQAAHGNMTSTNGGTVTIYAIWQRTIAFQSRSGGTITNTNVTQYYNSSTSSGAAITAPSTAARTPSGWTFTGWRDDTTANTYEVAPGGSTTPTTVTQYYAIYTATITFYHGYNKSKSNTATGYYNASSNTNQSVIAPAIQSITYWAAYGWKSDTTTTKTGAKTITTATAVNGMGEVTTYYALYSQSASLTYSGNDNTGGSTSATTSNTRYLNSGSTTLSSTTLSWTLANNGFTKTGYTFNGWDVGAAGATYSPTIAYNANPAKTATAQWTANTYTVHYNANGGTGTTMSDSTFTYDGTGNLRSNTYTAPTASGGGWSFQGWATTQARATAGTVDRTNGAAHGNLVTSGEITLYAVWKRDITFYSGANKATTNIVTQLWNGSAGVAITTPTPASISNWTALGWRDDTTAGTKEYSSAASLSPATTTYYAVYSSTITFYQGYNKATSGTATGYYNSNNVSTVTAPAITAISYWTARGWRDDTTAADREYAVTTASAITGFGTNRTFYAVYSQSATLTYAGNGNTGGSTSSTTSNTRYMNSGNTTLSSSTLTWILAQNGFTKTGYTFNKWDVGNAGANYSPSIAWNASPAKTATAQWNVNSYTVKLYGYGGIVEQTVSIAYGTTAANYPAIDIPTAPGYLFTGYYDANGITQWYDANGNGVRTFNLTSDQNWWAMWTRQGATQNMYVFDGTSWKVVTPYVFNGTEWKWAEAYVFDGTKWRLASTPEW